MRNLITNNTASTSLSTILMYAIPVVAILASLLWIGMVITWFIIGAICAYIVYTNTNDKDHKWIWTIAVFLFSIIGILIWYFVGPGKGSKLKVPLLN